MSKDQESFRLNIYVGSQRDPLLHKLLSKIDPKFRASQFKQWAIIGSLAEESILESATWSNVAQECDKCWKEANRRDE